MRLTPASRCSLTCLKSTGSILDFQVWQSILYNPQDNLVNVEQLLDKLESKISNFVCIYCEKVFKSYSVLKLHMRKKKHFKIDPKNHIYDEYYMVNYLEQGKNWEDI